MCLLAIGLLVASAASIVARVAASEVFGLWPSGAMAGLQPVWTTEPGACKLTLDLTKSSLDPFPKDPAAHAELVDLVQVVYNAADEGCTVVPLIIQVRSFVR